MGESKTIERLVAGINIAIILYLLLTNCAFPFLVLRGKIERSRVLDKIFNKESTKEKRRNLKKNMTDPERILWNHIRRDSLGVRFRRQYGIGNYIADFYCPQKKLVVELDGSQHYTHQGLEYDRKREEYMSALGIKTIRFSNIEVLNNTEGVIERLIEVIKK